jgi:hypothetical protein
MSLAYAQHTHQSVDQSHCVDKHGSHEINSLNSHCHREWVLSCYFHVFAVDPSDFAMAVFSLQMVVCCADQSF